jgi:hypothetical protein
VMVDGLGLTAPDPRQANGAEVKRATAWRATGVPIACPEDEH